MKFTRKILDLAHRTSYVCTEDIGVSRDLCHLTIIPVYPALLLPPASSSIVLHARRTDAHRFSPQTVLLVDTNSHVLSENSCVARITWDAFEDDK